MRQSKIDMSPGSSGEILSVGSAFRGQSYHIMGRNSTAGFIETFAKN